MPFITEPYGTASAITNAGRLAHVHPLAANLSTLTLRNGTPTRRIILNGYRQSASSRVISSGGTGLQNRYP